MYNFMRKAPADLRPRSDMGYHNKPEKKHYIEALLKNARESIGDMLRQNSDAELEKVLTKRTLASLEEEANFHGIVVLGELSKVQPPAWFERYPVYRSRAERTTMIRRIQDEAFLKEAYINGDLPVLKSPTRDCSWCPFNRMCQLHEAGELQSVEEYKETQFMHRDPYEAHHKSADA
jgi:CRISPR/Cas system-associated exonuclease Cas4 (RecB family)